MTQSSTTLEAQAQAAPAPALGGTLEALEEAQRYAAWLYSLAEAHLGSRVLEVGSGTGTLTQWIASRERVAALEIEPDYAEKLRARFATLPNVEVHEGSATDVELIGRAARGGVDSAMSFNVLEHIPDDEGVLRNVYELLPIGGRFVCFVPAFPILYGAYDKVLGHVRRYTRKELTAKMTRAGFTIVDVRYVNMPGFFLWFFSGRVLRKAGVPGGSRALRVYDRLVTPVTRTLEARVRPPFGQSLVAIGERR